MAADPGARQSSFTEEAAEAAPTAAAPATSALIYVTDTQAIWHVAWVADHAPLTIGAAFALCGRRAHPDSSLLSDFGPLWAYYRDDAPDQGATCPICGRLAPLELAWAKYPLDALSIPTGGPVTRCRSPKCQAPVWRGVTRAKGKESAFDVKPDGTFTGTNHWRTCLDREAFTTKGRT